MIRKGDKIEIEPEYRMPGEDQFDWYAIEDEDGDRVRVRCMVPDMNIKPTYILPTHYITGAAQ